MLPAQDKVAARGCPPMAPSLTCHPSAIMVFTSDALMLRTCGGAACRAPQSAHQRGRTVAEAVAGAKGQRPANALASAWSWRAVLTLPSLTWLSHRPSCCVELSLAAARGVVVVAAGADRWSLCGWRGRDR